MMKISSISAKKTSQVGAKSVPNSASLKTEQPTSKIRNFGWLVTGMVEACHQISADDLSTVERKVSTTTQLKTYQTTSS